MVHSNTPDGQQYGKACRSVSHGRSQIREAPVQMCTLGHTKSAGLCADHEFGSH